MLQLQPVRHYFPEIAKILQHIFFFRDRSLIVVRQRMELKHLINTIMQNLLLRELQRNQ